MKRFLSILFVSATIGLVAVPADATLFNRGGGLIYDSDLNITWLQDANYAYTSGYDADGRMTWYDAMTWADSLVYGGFSDWRLPKALAVNQSYYPFSFDGSTGYGYNVTTGSEMGHLYYTELGNNGALATDGTDSPPGWGLKNTRPFTNLQPYEYWSGTESTDTNWAWDFSFYSGGQFADPKAYDDLYGVDIFEFYAMAVRSGDPERERGDHYRGGTGGSGIAAVPEPGTMMLLGSCVAGLVAFRKRSRFKQG